MTHHITMLLLNFLIVFLIFWKSNLRTLKNNLFKIHRRKDESDHHKLIKCIFFLQLLLISEKVVTYITKIHHSLHSGSMIIVILFY